MIRWLDWRSHRGSLPLTIGRNPDRRTALVAARDRVETLWIDRSNLGTGQRKSASSAMSLWDRVRQFRVRRISERARDGRARIKDEFGALFDEVSALLFRADPIGINFESNHDEYDPKTGTILPRLRSCDGPEAVLEVVFEEFQRWFSTDLAGERERYREVSRQIWEAWRSFTRDPA